MQMYGPRQGSRTLPSVKFFWKLFLYVIILIQIYILYIIYIHGQVITFWNRYFHFFKFLREVVWKNSKKWPKAGYLRLNDKLYIVYTMKRPNKTCYSKKTSASCRTYKIVSQLRISSHLGPRLEGDNRQRWVHWCRSMIFVWLSVGFVAWPSVLFVGGVGPEFNGDAG